MAKGIYERKGKQGDLTYYIRYQFQGTDIKERVGRKSRGFTREMAKEALKSRLGDIARGQFSLEKSRKPVPFSKLAERYREYASSNWRAWDKEKHLVEVFGRYFGDNPLSQITTWQIEKWKVERCREVKPNTVNRQLTVIKHMFKKAVEWGLARTNPAAGVKQFSYNDQRTRYLTEEEIDRLINACKLQESRPWLTPLVTLALNTGMRQGELLKLRWEQVNWDSNSFTLKQPKTLRVKTIPLNEAAKEALKWFNDHRYGDYVIMHHWGKSFQRSTVNKSFKMSLSKAKITNCRWNDMRHTFASHLVMEEIDLPTVSELMGHSNITMTMRYAHLAPKHKEEAVAKLAERYQRSESENAPKSKVINGGVLDPMLAQNRNVSLSGDRQVSEMPSEHEPVLRPVKG